MRLPWLTTEGTFLEPVLFVAALLWLSLGVGRRLLIVLGAAGEGEPAERGILAVALGAGALQYVPFALGAVGVLGTRSVAIAAAVVALAASFDMWAVARAVLRAIRGARRPEPWVLAWIAALAPALVVAALIACAPTIDPDGMGYHLTVPKRWLAAGRLEYLPTYPYSNSPMGVEMLYTLALALAGDSAAKCVHLCLGGLGIAGLYLVGKRAQSAVTGATVATLFLVGPFGVCAVLGCAYVEGAAAFAMVASALAWVLWFQTRSPGTLRCASLLAGIAVTFKITAALLPVAELALTCVVLVGRARESSHDRARKDATRAGVRTALGASILMAIPVLPWMTRSAIVTGNPVFPLFARVIASRDLPPDLSAKFDRFNRYMTWGNTFGRDWSMGERSHVLLGVCAVIALAGAISFFLVRSWFARGLTVVVTIVFLAQASAAGLYVRYSIPLAAVGMLPIVAGIVSGVRRRGPAALWIGLTLVVSLLQARRCLAQNGTALAPLARTDLGLEDRHAFLTETLALYPLYEDANTELAPDAKIMLSCYCSAFYIDRTTYCGEMVQSSLRYTSWDDFRADLRRLGITHVIAPIALATGGPAPPLERSSVSTITRESQYRMVRALLTEHSHPRATAVDQGLYELDPEFLRTP
jgi:hypothetical protein